MSMKAEFKGYLKKFESKLMNCTRCAYCHADCPTFDIYGLESAVARGRLRIIHSLAKGDLEISDYAIKRIYDCLLCGHCEINCPAGLNIPDLINDARIELVRTLKTPVEILDAVVGELKKTSNVFGKPPLERSKWIPETIRILPQATIAYFPGCVAAYRVQQIAQASAECLQALNIPFTVLGEKEHCCGGFALWSGYEDVYKDLTAKVSDSFDNAGVEEVITSCSSCYYILKNRFKSKPEVIHFSQLFAEAIDQGKLRFEPLKITVTYHDPCHLGRGSKIFEEPRKVLENIPSLKLVEMNHHHVNSRCCGGGAGVVWTAFPSLSMRLAEDRLNEAIDVGASALVTACPQCHVNFTLAAKRRRLPIKIYDLAQVLEKTIKK